MDKQFIKDNIVKFKSHPKSVFEWIDFFKLDKKEKVEFINAVDQLVDTYEVIIKDNLLYLGEWFNYFSGQIKVNKRGFGFIDFEDRPSIYISKDNLNNVYDKDIIVVEVINNQDEAIVIKVVKRSLEKIVGLVLTQRKPIKFISDNFMYDNKIRILNIDKYKNIHRHKVLLRVINFEDNVINTNIEDVLGHADDPGVDILAVLLENDIRVNWPKAVNQQLKVINDYVSEEEKINRRDLSDQLIVTIDGDDAKDLDDAISIEKVNDNYLLGVHIMDVSHYVRENSAIDKEAYARGTSLYVTDRVVSMLPFQLSNGICSLSENKERLCISVNMEINKNGNVVNYDIFKSLIKSKKKLTYNKVNELLANPGSVEDYAFVEDKLVLMSELADILQNKRDCLGAIDFDKDEIVLNVNDENIVVDVALRKRGVAERMIENFMVTTNETIGRLMAYSDWPNLYRIHEKPEAKKMRSFAQLAQILGYNLKGSMDDVHPKILQNLLNESKNSDNHFIISTQLLRSMQKARYDFNNVGHFGLGSSEYSHFTAPIRRYPDLIVHRLLKKYFFDNNFSSFDSDEKYLEEAGKHLSALERKAIVAEREVNDMKIAEYMESKINHKYNGIISSVHNFGMFVRLDNLIEGLVRIDTLNGFYNLSPDGFSLIGNNNVYRIGQKVKVRVVSANKHSRNIDFELVEKRKRKNENYRKK